MELPKAGDCTRPNRRAARLIAHALLLMDIDVGAFARARLEQVRQAAAEAGYVLGNPALEPMGIGHGFTDVTGHIGVS